jgi:small subunit ribosomal protein S13
MEEKSKPEHKKPEGRKPEVMEDIRLVRILQKDIPGGKKVHSGLTSIKGISWAFSNAICTKLKIDKNKRIQDLTKEEIEEIAEFIKHPQVPLFLINRRKDFDSGDNKHLSGVDLDLQKEFDIKRSRKIRSYKGIRHSLGQPVRGQRTKSHFRKERKKSGAVGVRKVKSAAAPKPKTETKSTKQKK